MNSGLGACGPLEVSGAPTRGCGQRTEGRGQRSEPGPEDPSVQPGHLSSSKWTKQDSLSCFKYFDAHRNPSSDSTTSALLASSSNSLPLPTRRSNNSLTPNGHTLRGQSLGAEATEIQLHRIKVGLVATQPIHPLSSGKSSQSLGPVPPASLDGLESK